MHEKEIPQNFLKLHFHQRYARPMHEKEIPQNFLKLHFHQRYARQLSDARARNPFSTLYFFILAQIVITKYIITYRKTKQYRKNIWACSLKLIMVNTEIYYLLVSHPLLHPHSITRNFIADNSISEFFLAYLLATSLVTVSFAVLFHVKI
jgi:hypothetical protein